MDIKNKKIAITGYHGFIGSHLAKRLCDEEAKIVYMERPYDYSKLKDIDYLFHIGWQTDAKKAAEDPLNDLKENLIPIIEILEYCKKNNNNIKIIFTSSTTVEESPLTIYDTHKLLAEKYLWLYYKLYGIKYATLRFSNVFGERSSYGNRAVLNLMIEKALKDEDLTVYGNGSFIRDYCYIENYIDALLISVIPITDGKTYNLGSGEGRAFMEVCLKIQNMVKEITNNQDMKSKIVSVPFPENNPMNNRSYIADYFEFNKDTGWRPKINFDQGLKSTIRFAYFKVGESI